MLQKLGIISAKQLAISKQVYPLLWIELPQLVSMIQLLEETKKQFNDIDFGAERVV